MTPKPSLFCLGICADESLRYPAKLVNKPLAAFVSSELPYRPHPVARTRYGALRRHRTFAV